MMTRFESQMEERAARWDPLDNSFRCEKNF